MVKVFVVYDTKYGNTKLAAEKIVEGMKEAEGIQTSIGDVEETTPEQAAGFDAILVGSPNHFGGPVGGIKRFIDKLGKIDLEAKWVGVFDTYEGGDFEKTVKKMEKRIGKKVPALKLITPGLSIKVDGTKGPITDGELPKCKEFGKKIAHKLNA